MAIAIDPNEPWDYRLKSEAMSPEATVFKLKALTVGEEAALQDKLIAVSPDKQTRVASGTHELEILRFGLIGWVGLRRANGDDVPFSVDLNRKHMGRAFVSDAALSMLAPWIRRELAEAIIERNTMSEAEEKNY